MLDVTGFRFGSDEERPDDAGPTVGDVHGDGDGGGGSLRDIAIIGLSAELPLAADAEQFWRNLRGGLDAVGPFPPGRREDVKPYVCGLGIEPEEAVYYDGAYLEEIDKFDPGFFRMSPRDAALTSPSQRLFLQTAWKAVEDAGYGGSKLAGTNTGVYIGYCADAVHDYKRLIAEEDPAGIPIAIPGNLTSVIAGRIAYTLDLKGPALAIDTACSSSLVALHTACQAIRAGECELAIAGSVKTLVLPIDTGMRVGIESSDGRARPFDDSSDGTGMGEGSAAVLLKPLAQALADGDPVYAVVKGSAVNQDGSSAGITAPNAAAQEEVIVQAWLNAGIDPETVSYIEAHGTGTKLGDPIEIEGITRAFRRFTDKRQFCAVGSVKSNLGHLDNAAGIVGLVKAVLSLKHGELPPSLHYKRPNRHIDLIDSPVYVNDRLQRWEAGSSPRRCGVSAFGLSGTNCHVVLEEAPAAAASSAETGETAANPSLLVLSARSEQSLLRTAQAYADVLERNAGSGPDLADLCYTASTGRGRYEYRLAAVAASADELLRLLRRADRLPSGDAKGGLLYSHAPHTAGAVPSDPVLAASEARALIERLAAAGGADDAGASTGALLERLGALYVQGADIRWEPLYERQKRRRLNLPAYSFDKVRCWVAGGGARRVRGAVDTGSRETAAGQPAVAEERVPYAAGQSVESVVEDAMARVLGVRPGPDDDFFALGGHSLSAVQLVADLGAAFGIGLSLDQVFLSPTVRAMAETIRGHTSAVAERIGSGPANDSGVYPASSAQKRLFLMQELQPGDVGYNMPAMLEIVGPVDTGRLKETMRKVIARHESLRTTFGWEGGMVVQRIHRHAEPDVTMLEAEADNFDAAVRGFVRPFQLDRLPLVRLGIVRERSGRRFLLFDMHHIVSDGYSVGRLADEFARLYAGEALPPLPIQYRDYAAWQARRIESGALLAHERYWKRRFAEPATKLRFASDGRGPSAVGASGTSGTSGASGASGEGGTVFFQTDEALSVELSSLAARTGATLFMVLLAAYYVLLSRCTAEEDITVGTAVAGRIRAELEPLIGMFVNTLALRHNPAAGKPFRQLLSEVKEGVREALEHQEYPFELLVEELNGRGLPGDSSPALFQTMFVHQNTEPPTLDYGETSLRAHPFDFGLAKFDLTLQSWAREGTIAFALEYRAAKFSRDEAAALAEQYVRILRLAADGGDFVIHDADLLSDEEAAAVGERIRRNKQRAFADFDF